MAPSVLALVLLLAACSAREQSRWSRQISTYTADISDWVPLPGPVEQPSSGEIKRQAVAEPRILAEPFPGFTRPTGFGQDFPRNQPFYQPNRPLYLQSMPSVPSAPQNFLTDQGFGQSIRFGLSQPNFPLNQGFVAPQFSFDSVPQIKPRPPTVPTNPIKFENFQKTNLPSPQAKPFINQAPKKPHHQAPKFVDGYRLENASNDFAFTQKKPQSLQKLKFDAPREKTETIGPNKSKLEREEVQLLYVPVESLNRGQFNFRNPQIQSDLYSQGLPKQNPIKQAFANEFQRPSKPAEHTNFGQEYFNYNPQIKEYDQVPKFSTITTPFPTAPPTTPKPKKLKPHQPPLAVFLSQEAKKGAQVKVGDVLSSLKNANTIAVLDAVNPLNAPKVFIGPSTLTPPENYVKFELPYLSNIENSDKKLRQLPFFVAPLSYHTPDGFAKIPFPSPHVGSVVINAQIKDTAPATLTTPTADVIPNSYVASPPSHKHGQNPVTQKPNFSYYSTVAPKTNSPPAHQSEYYSFEPQTVTSIRPSKAPTDSIITAPPKTGSYFLGNVGQQYNPNQYVEFPQDNYSQEQVKPNIARQPEPTTTRAPKTTSKPSSTYSSQLLETHNPYSINQAFHFSTPLDYNNFFDEYKENYSTQQFKPLPSTSASPTPSPTPSTTIKPEIVTEKQSFQQQSSPNYIQQNYSPEIHYESEIQSSRFPTYNSNEFTTKTEYTRPETVNTNNLATVTSVNLSTDNRYVETQTPLQDNLAEVNEIPTTASGASVQPTNPSYNHYDTSFISNESKESSTTTTTTSTTTRRTPIRGRGRPRYTTPRTDSNESSTKFTATRRPLRERRPLPTRPRYEPNKITTEKPTRKPVDSSESTTKTPTYSSRTRTRGRVQYKLSDSDEGQYNRNKGNSKEEDLAYQRDVLHQNYPVTLMEKTSTVDIDAITEPTTKFQSTKNFESPVTDDTENAYTYERASVSHPNTNSASNENTFPSRSEVRTETPYVPHVPSTRKEEYVYHSRSSSAPVDAISYDESSPDNEDIYAKQTTPIQKDASGEVSYATEAISPVTEQAPSFSVSIKQDESAAQENEDAKFLSEEENREEQEVQTTPSYNRVRVRPGVIRQYHQSSSTETSKIKERKRPVQAITYRPAFDRRRTTMRIEEIGEDLKTKQVHARPEVQEHRHPVYKPEPTTQPPATSASQESSTKRGQFRRRRPTYTTTSTEASNTKKSTYEVKNRFRGRRPTEKPTDKPEVQTEASSTTVRNTLHSRYSARPRLSERYNKKPEVEEQDQEPNYSINRPKFAEPEVDQWSTDSFKPYNPNDIIDDRKDSTSGVQNDDEGELDIITAKNEYEDILISVTPATNRLNKKIPDIPPTLEALVEQSKVTKSDSPDTMSTFESMLEEVMKSLEEQDEDEYTTNVMKHKGGEIGEIPPERIISSGDNYSKPTTQGEEATTVEPSSDTSILNEEDKDRKGRRRGFWKKVNVRPATTESIEAAESQYYSHTVNRLGDPVAHAKASHQKADQMDKPHKVTTYKPTFSTKDIFTDDSLDELLAIDIPKINTSEEKAEPNAEPQLTTENILQKETPTEISPGDFDLGTGSPDPTIAELFTTTEAVSEASDIDRSDGFSFMDYLFGTTTSDTENEDKKSATTETKVTENPVLTTEPSKIRITTTENNIIPEEITAIPESDDSVEPVTEFTEIKKSNTTEAVAEAKSEVTEKSVVRVESSSVSSFMDPANVVSTSLSTEVSHETEICFRGKCIKTSKDLL